MSKNPHNLSDVEMLVGGMLPIAVGPFIAYDAITGFNVLINLALALATAVVLTVVGVGIGIAIVKLRYKGRR